MERIIVKGETKDLVFNWELEGKTLKMGARERRNNISALLRELKVALEKMIK